MERKEKQQTVQALGETFRSIDNAFLINYIGLKVVDATELRRKIREMDGSYVVVKNTLAKRAAKDTGLEKLSGHFEGPTAIAYHPRDVVGLAKLLSDAVKANPNLRFKAAMVEGKVIASEEIQSIAAMPSREVLLARLAYVLMAPLQRLVTVLKAPVRDLAVVVKQIEK